MRYFIHLRGKSCYYLSIYEALIVAESCSWKLAIIRYLWNPWPQINFGSRCNYYVNTLLCRYRKRTDIYYLTWSFENVAKNCQFQFLDPPPHNIVKSNGVVFGNFTVHTPPSKLKKKYNTFLIDWKVSKWIISVTSFFIPLPNKVF